VIAQQLIFGYRDGHRRLGGSAEIDSVAETALLGATDARVGPNTNRLISALPLPSVGLYALSGIWPAPERGRAGAVWAHALLVPLDQIGDLDRLETVASALRRPSLDALVDFTRPLELSEDWAPMRHAEPALLAQLLAAATEPEGIAIATASDLAKGEAALFAVWDSAWPDLRTTLSFRTRERVKTSPQLGYLCVARRVTGMWRPRDLVAGSRAARFAESRWVRELAEAGSRPEDRRHDFLAFLRAFGPEEPPRLAHLVSLGLLHDLIGRDEPGPVARMFAVEHPKRNDAAALKRALFGRLHADWWNATELNVVLAVFGVGGKSFDLKSLELTQRVRSLVAAGHVIELIDARPANSKRLRSILFAALVEEATPSLLLDILGADRSLGEDLARALPELLERRDFWSNATDEQASALAAVGELSDRAIAAAVLGGRVSALKPVVPLSSVALRLARAGELGALRRLFDDRTLAEALAGENGEELRIELAAAGVDTGAVAELLRALEARRDRIDDAWLRAAVSALTSTGASGQRAALEVVFGPLHHAITDDRLPYELWEKLGRIAPRADDPAMRLRRLLVARARDEVWPSEALVRALRDSGPYMNELKAEVRGDDDDAFVAAAKAALKIWKRYVG
jgi:hypothetical protein